MSLPHLISQPTVLDSGGLRCSHSHTSTLLDQGLIQLRIKEIGGKDHPGHRRVALSSHGMPEALLGTPGVRCGT